MGVILALILIGIILIAGGVIIHGLFELLLIGVAVLILALIIGALRRRRHRVRR